MIGAAATVVVVWLRRATTETARVIKVMHFKEAGSLRAPVPHWRAGLLVMAFAAGGALHCHSFTTQMQKCPVVTVGFDRTTVTIVMTAALPVFMPASRCSGCWPTASESSATCCCSPASAWCW